MGRVVDHQPPDAEAALTFIHDFLGQRTWWKTDEIIRSVFGTKRTTAVRACTGSSKTKTLADLALAWMCTGPDRLVITTAPSNRQVKSLLWKEIRASYRAADKRGLPIGGTLLPVAPHLRYEEGWEIIGFSSDDPINVSGWHSRGGTLVIVDEAMGVVRELYDTLLSTLTGTHDRLAAIANPNLADGWFYDLFQDAEEDTNLIHISAFDTPNVVEGWDVIPGMTTRAAVAAMERRWGKNHPFYKAKVLGEFPDNADDVLVPHSWFMAANVRHDEITARKGWDGPGCVGGDVARFGADSTVAALARALGIQELRKAFRMDTQVCAGWFINLLLEWVAFVTEIRIDADGLGAGVYDTVARRLAEEGSALEGIDAVEIHGGLPALDDEMFFNRRSEWFWSLREMLDPDNPYPIALPRDDALKAQLTSIKWGLNPRGQLRVESKDEMRKRGLPSPDEADAVAYGMAILSANVKLVADESTGHRVSDIRRL